MNIHEHIPVIRPQGVEVFDTGNERVRLTAIERRQQIIEKATVVIGANGYWGFTIRQVAQACSLTEPAVLYHFKSKENLMVAVLMHRDEVDMTSVAQQMGLTEPDLWKEPAQFSLREFCHAAMVANTNQPEIVRLYTVLQAESLSSKHPAYAYFQDREAWVINLFTRAAIHEGLDNPERIAKIFLAQMDGIQIRWLRDMEHVDLVAEWDHFAASFQDAQ